MNKSIYIMILILSFLVGWLFSEAYFIGPKKHYKRGYEAAKQELLNK